MAHLPPPAQIVRNVQINNVSVHRFVFRDPITKKNVDPDTLLITVKQEDGDEVNYVYPDTHITRTTVGVYYVLILHDEPGMYHIRTTTTDPNFEAVAYIEVIDSY